MPLISVCIPTLNDQKSLVHNLDLLCKKKDLSIEILVCDDCLDNTIFSIIEKYQSKLKIQYFKGDKVSLDGALIKLIEKSSGDYIWFLGDDLLLPDSLDNVTKILSERENLVFLWINSHSASDGKLTFNISNDIYFTDRDRLLDFDIGLLGFISATVFKRESALPSITKAKLHIGSSFACLYIIMFVLSVEGNLGIFSKSCFKSREKPSGEVRWYEQYQVFGLNLYDIVVQFDNVFSSGALREALSRNLTRTLKSIIYERAIGLKTGFALEHISIKPMFLKYYNFKQFWFFLPLLILPRFILRSLYKIFKILGSK
ncbi:glycosyltransferase family 2 protein [Candidatus Pseudothioglobus singularis]|nr:glycosyltransferase family 2 protein [Candidatus Pseudothioglobus singularis]